MTQDNSSSSVAQRCQKVGHPSEWCTHTENPQPLFTWATHSFWKLLELRNPGLLPPKPAASGKYAHLLCVSYVNVKN